MKPSSEVTMDFGQIYHFLFETYAGIGVLLGASLVICVIVAALLELRTRKTYVDRGERAEDDEWSLFDDEGEGDGEGGDEEAADSEQPRS